MAARAQFLTLVPLLAALEDAQAATPITKVVELLHGMVAEAEAEKQAEQVEFAAFTQWCTDETSNKQAEVEAADDNIEFLAAKIQKAGNRIRQLSERVQELDADVGHWEGDAKSAADVRSKERVDYQATSQEYMETIDAVDKAVLVLKKQDVDRAQAEEALLQVQASHLVPKQSKAALGAFLQAVQKKAALKAFLQNGQPEELSYEAPEAHAYEFQSGGIVDMLEKLKSEFATKKSELDQEEMNAQHAHEQLQQALHDNVAAANKEIAKKTTGKEQTAASKAEAQGYLTKTQEDREEDARYLNDMKALCNTKSSDFERRTKLRQQELNALNKAIEIVSSDAVAGAGDKHLPTMLQVHRAGTKVLVKLRSSTLEVSPIQTRLAQFLSQKATNINSRLLALVSQHVAMDPFDKVKQMVKDLISKLTQEAAAETEHKGWCDAELASNKMTRTAASEDVEQLSADIEDLKAQMAQLSQDVTDLSSDLRSLAADVAEANSERMEAKAKNAQTMKEAKEAQLAVTQAVAVLKEFYAKAADAISFVQKGKPEEMAAAIDAPNTWESSYKGRQASGGSVIDILEVIDADFARLEAETSTAEAAEQHAHETFMFEAEKDKALKENEMSHKENNKVNKEGDLHSTERELQSAQERLETATKYYGELKPTCVDSGITYEERVTRREAEMQSLQEALQILQGENIP